MMIPPEEILLRLGASIVLGGSIGFERGRHDHPAGLRTHTLVSLSSAMFMMISTHAMHVDQPVHPGVVVSFDPTRIASYVVAGIGFLGGGAIARTGLTVRGLTTAASLWLVTAIGLAAGAGLYLAALIGTALGLGVLSGFRKIEYRPPLKINRRVRLDLDGSADLGSLVDRFRAEGLVAGSLDIERDVASGLLVVSVVVTQADDSQVVPLLDRLDGIPGLRKIAVSHQQPAEPAML